MAKAKKSESTPKPDAKKAAPAPKAAAKKPAAPGGQPVFDTGLAAQNAARHLVAGISSKAPAPITVAPTSARNESSGFKNLKQGLSKSNLSGLNSILDKSGPPDGKKSNLPFGGFKQVGHTQTKGADVTRSGVPRRTAG